MCIVQSLKLRTRIRAMLVSEYGRDVGAIVMPADFLDLLERLIPMFNLLSMHQRDPAAYQHVFLLTLPVSRCVL